MIISHLKIIAFQLKRIAMDVLLLFTEFCLYNKQKNTWVLGNTRFNSRVELACSQALYIEPATFIDIFSIRPL